MMIRMDGLAWPTLPHDQLISPQAVWVLMQRLKQAIWSLSHTPYNAKMPKYMLQCIEGSEWTPMLLGGCNAWHISDSVLTSRKLWEMRLSAQYCKACMGRPRRESWHYIWANPNACGTRPQNHYANPRSDSGPPSVTLHNACHHDIRSANWGYLPGWP